MCTDTAGMVDHTLFTTMTRPFLVGLMDVEACCCLPQHCLEKCPTFLQVLHSLPFAGQSP